MGNELMMNTEDMIGLLEEIQMIKQDLNQAGNAVYSILEAYSEGSGETYQGQGSEALTSYFGSMASHVALVAEMVEVLQQYILEYMDTMLTVDSSTAAEIQITE